MTNKTNNDIPNAFDIYKEVIFGLNVDLEFWKYFLNQSIFEYKMKNPEDIELYSAIFSTYNINQNTNDGILKTHNKSASIKIKDLENHCHDFFNWVSNLSILKAYNALEIFILQAIQIKYFTNINNSIEDKCFTKKISREITSYLKNIGINVDKKNNRYIIQFIKHKSTDINIFLNNSVRTDLTTNWENFFELISILRNIIAHNGMIVSPDIFSEINSKAGDIFKRHFSLSKTDKYYNILSPTPDHFSDFISLYNDFALNSVKLMYGKNDLTIFKMT